MASKNLLDGKRLLIVDDEPDVLETLEELLPMCSLAKAHSFHEAKERLEGEYFDMAILDIMGVDGYDHLVEGERFVGLSEFLFDKQDITFCDFGVFVFFSHYFIYLIIIT